MNGDFFLLFKAAIRRICDERQILGVVYKFGQRKLERMINKLAFSPSITQPGINVTTTCQVVFIKNTFRVIPILIPQGIKQVFPERNSLAFLISAPSPVLNEVAYLGL